MSGEGQALRESVMVFKLANTDGFLGSSHRAANAADEDSGALAPDRRLRA
jgi:hypothetical protein